MRNPGAFSAGRQNLPGSAGFEALLHGERRVTLRGAVVAHQTGDDGVDAGSGVVGQGIRHVVLEAAVAIGHRGLVRRPHQAALIPDLPHQGGGHRHVVRSQDGVINPQHNLLSRSCHGGRGHHVVHVHYIALPLVVIRLGRSLGRADLAVAV